MEVIKKLGNNAAICKDNSGRELIALGLGIGFPKCPYTLDDLSKIERTFYNVDNEYLHLFENVDSNILALSADVIDLATTMLSVSLKENAIYTLADHLNFAVIRLNKGMIFNTPISNELRDLYPVEVKVAKYTLNLMKKKLNIELPEEEMYAIAMNIINSEEILSSTSDVSVKSEFILELVFISFPSGIILCAFSVIKHNTLCFILSHGLLMSIIIVSVLMASLMIMIKKPS